MKKLLLIALLSVLLVSCWEEKDTEEVIDTNNSETIIDQDANQEIIDEDADTSNEDADTSNEDTDSEEDTDNDTEKDDEYVREVAIPDPYEEHEEFSTTVQITEEEILEDIDSLINDIIKSEND